MRTGRGDDFDDFFRAVFPLAVRAAARVSWSSDAAEDAALEALVRAYVRWPRVQPLPHRDAWVMRTAINVALRANTRRSGPLPPGASIQAVPQDNVVDRLVVSEALGRLSDRQRDAVVLRYLCDLSETDTASALEVSVGALKSHLDRARRALRVALGPSAAKEFFDADR